MHVPDLISDLALMLIVAGITTVLFKKLKQPLVLGYILAGFLTGPYFSFLPSVADIASVNTWSEIGIIFLMFALGLEFNLHKLASAGGTAIITAMTEVAGMLGLGFLVGQALGWNFMNSIFLGGILAMSSTTIIIKAFDELNLRGKKFTELVFGTLIIEDIAGIFMMIIISTIAVSSGVSGIALAQKLSLMLLYLALWLLLGIYIIPTVLKKIKALMNDETLLVVSIGLCLGMVLLAVKLGFSSALGAFLAGSILAGTIHAERIEHLIGSVKDLFGAVFFISVGMLVNPALLKEFWLPIIIITLTTIIGKLIFSTSGMLLSGQSLNTSLHSGFSLAQIGEFAFIITALGSSLGVTSDFLYPIVVSVSVITTLTTPFCIRCAKPANNLLQKILPDKWLIKLNRFTSEDPSEREGDNEWKLYIRHYFSRLLIYSVIIIGIIYLGINLFFPFATDLIGDKGGRLATIILILLLESPFLVPLMQLRNRYFTHLWLKSRYNHPPLIALNVIKLAIVIMLIIIPVQQLYNFAPVWIVVAALILTLVISRSDWLNGSYLRVEARFLCNFNERKLKARQEGDVPHCWLDEQLFVADIDCLTDSNFAGKTLMEMRWGEIFDVNVIKIIRGKRHINIPARTEKIRPGDKLYCLGSEMHLNNLFLSLKIEGKGEDGCYQSLRCFIEDGQDGINDEDQLLSYAVIAKKEMGIVGQSIKDAKIKDKWSCFVIGMERENYPLTNPSYSMTIKSDDLIWLLGEQKMVAKLFSANLLELDNEDEAASPQTED